MLDQNTDRMWFVIGAVIVGAAIIFIANGTLPDIFASVTDTFENSSKNAMDTVDSIDAAGDNLIDFSVHSIKFDHRVNHYSGEIVHNDVPSKPGANSTWYSSIVGIEVVGGKHYRFSAPEGLASPIIGFYDANNEPVDWGYFPGEPNFNVMVVAPTNAKYAAISAGDLTIKPDREVSPVTEWEFVQMF